MFIHLKKFFQTKIKMFNKSQYKKNIASIFTFFIFILIATGTSESKSEKDINKELADYYEVSVKKVEQCKDVWTNSKYRWNNFEYLLGYIYRSKGFFGFFKPSCDGSIKEDFENYKSAFLSAPVNGQTSQECEDWDSVNSMKKKKNCLLEDFIFLYLEGGLSIEEIAFENDSANTPYKIKLEKEAAEREARKKSRKRSEPCEGGFFEGIDLKTGRVKCRWAWEG
jgi:hypothetical protein